jgi:hypothetical protein
MVWLKYNEYDFLSGSIMIINIINGLINIKYTVKIFNGVYK